MNELEKIKLWEYLKKNFIANIKDEKTRILYYKTLLIKATQAFGFNPEKCIISKKQEIELDSWEKEFVEDIQKQKVYEIDTREEKRKLTNKEARSRMSNFIEKGGSFCDLPKDLQNESIAKLYFETLSKKIDECENFLFTK